MNYTQLSAAIKSYCENEFPQTVDTVTSVQQINYFITQAEQRIYNSVQFPSIRKNVTGYTTNGNKYLSCPSDFLAVYSMAVIANSEYVYLLNKDVNFIREAFPSVLTADNGLPRYYALFGPATTNQPSPQITNELTFLLGPTPDATYSVELHYYYYPESITTANTTWLGDNFDSVLLYGAMLEAATFMKTDGDVLNNYVSRYNEALALAKRLGDGMERQDAYRSGQYRQPVR